MGIVGNNQYNDPNNPNLSGNDPTLTNDPSNNVITGTGVGGSSINLSGLSVFIGPSNLGISGTNRGSDAVISSDVNASDPNLLRGTSTLNFGSVLTSFFTPTGGTTKDPDAADVFTLFSSPDATPADGTGSPAKPGSTSLMAKMLGPEFAQKGVNSKDPVEVFQALLSYADIESLPLTPDQKAFLSGKLETLAKKIGEGNNSETPTTFDTSNPEALAAQINEMLGVSDPSISPANKKALELVSPKLTSGIIDASVPTDLGGISSTDEKEVYKGVLAYTNADIDTATNPTQKKVILEKLAELSKAISLQNASSGPNPLNSSDPETILNALKGMLKLDTDKTLSPSDKSLLVGYLNSAANGMGAINAASGIAPPADPMYLAMTSNDPVQIEEALTKMAASGGMTPAQLTEIGPQIKELAAKIAEGNPPVDPKNPIPQTMGDMLKRLLNGIPGLESAEPKTLSETLTLLMSFENNTLIPDGTKVLLRAFVDNVSVSMAATNKGLLTEAANSTDAKIVGDALIALSNVKYNKDLSPEEKTATENYLRILATALSFMASVRATIVQLEAEFRKSEAAGKLGNIKDQTRLALMNFTKNVKDIANNLNDQLAAITRSLILKIFFPFIAIILAIIAIVLIIVTLGAASPVAIALICLTVALTAFTILDSTCNIIGRICEACGCTDSAAKAGINAAIQAIIMVLMIIATLGIAAPCMAAMKTAEVAGKVGMELAKAVIKQVLDQGARAALKESINVVGNITKAELASVVMMAVSIPFSSGLVTAALTKLFKACGMSDEQAAIAAMLTTLILMLAMMAAAAEALGGGISSAISSGVKSVAGKAADMAKGMMSTADDTINLADDMVSVGVKSTVDEALDTTKETIKEATKEAIKQADDAKVGGDVGVGSSVKTAADAISDTASSNTINRMIQNVLKRMEEICDDPTKLTNIVMALQAAAEIAQNTMTIASEVQQIGFTKQRIQLTADMASAQAALEYLKKLVPAFDMNLNSVQKDGENFAEFYADVLKLFASFVDSASNITTQMHQTS